VTVLPEALPGMPRSLFSCTPSRLAGFDCPRRYRFTYLDRPPPMRGRAWAHNTLGAVVHLALARWWALPLPQRTPAAGEALVVESWQDDGFRDPDQSGRWRSIAAAWVGHYVRGLDPARQPIGVERTVSATTDTLAISGRVDRLDDCEGALTVVDYKTGPHVLSVEDARDSQALALYAVAARRTLRRDGHRVELHHLPTGTVAAFEHTDESLARHISRAEATAGDIVSATDALKSGADPDDAFPPRPARSCAWCDFRAHCPEGSAASGEFQPWAGLDSDG
jgi:RecB family exonuclease